MNIAVKIYCLSVSFIFLAEQISVWKRWKYMYVCNINDQYVWDILFHHYRPLFRHAICRQCSSRLASASAQSESYTASLWVNDTLFYRLADSVVLGFDCADAQSDLDLHLLIMYTLNINIRWRYSYILTLSHSLLQMSAIRSAWITWLWVITWLSHSSWLSDGLHCFVVLASFTRRLIRMSSNVMIVVFSGFMWCPFVSKCFVYCRIRSWHMFFHLSSKTSSCFSDTFEIYENSKHICSESMDILSICRIQN